MKIAVTGGTGFIGSHLVKKLVDLGHRPIIVIGKEPHFENIKELNTDTVALIWRGQDLQNYDEAIKALEGVDTVYHLAATVGSLEYLHGSPEADLYALQSNLVIDTNVFRACLENNVKTLIYASSVAVYPMDEQYEKDAIFSEVHILNNNPDGGYGWAKLVGEATLKLMMPKGLGQRGINVGIARIFSAYGENEPLEKGKAHLIGDICRKIIEGANHLEIEGGKQTRDYLYVTDCVEALVRLGQYTSDKTRGFSVFNIGSGEASSVHSIVHKLITISGKDIEVTFRPIRQNNPMSRTADITRIKRFLHWHPTVSLDDGLERTYKWAEKTLKH